MEVFADYLSRITNPAQRARVEEILHWIAQRYPDMNPKMAWNQPMFTHHGTFIIGFSVAAKHLAVAPEQAAIARFAQAAAAQGYGLSKELIRIPWDKPVAFALLEEIITFNRLDKVACTTFWRKPAARI